MAYRCRYPVVTIRLAISGALNADARLPATGQPGAACTNQYFGAAPPDALHDALPPLALQDDLPLLAGAAPPLALHEAFPPEADGSFAGGVLPPPQATVDPISIPATADTARVFARFISGLLALP
jgi:hypothetical protein